MHRAAELLACYPEIIDVCLFWVVLRRLVPAKTDERLRRIIREELRPVTRRLSRPERNTANIATGLIDLTNLVNDLHDRLTKLEESEPWKDED